MIKTKLKDICTNDVKVCTNCKILNYRINEKCVNPHCRSTSFSFDEHAVRDVLNDEYRLLKKLNKLPDVGDNELEI